MKGITKERTRDVGERRGQEEADCLQSAAEGRLLSSLSAALPYMFVLISARK